MTQSFPVLHPRRAALRVLAVGDLIPENRFETLLEAFAALRPSQPQACLILLGEGPERGRLENEISRFGLADAVGLPGILPMTRTIEFLQRAHVCYIPEAAGPGALPPALPIAISTGVCLIGSVDGAAAQFIEDGITGLLVEPADSEELSRALHRALGSGDLRREMGERAALSGRAPALSGSSKRRRSA
jgi:glycogen(starch) synthase